MKLPARTCLLTLAIVFAGCVNRTATDTPPRVRVVIPESAPSATPTLEAARRISAEADIHGTNAATRVGDAKTGLTEARADYQGMVVEVDRLRKQKSANENELLALYNRLVEQDKKFSVLLSDLTAAESSLQAERSLRKQSADALVEAQRLVQSKEDEVRQLRGALKLESENADAYQKASENNARIASDNARRASESEGRESILWRFLIGAGIALAVSIAFNVVQLRGRFPL